MKQLYTSAAVESEKFQSSSVIFNLDQYIKKFEKTCNVQDFGGKIAGASDKSSAEKAINDFIKNRTEYQKLIIQRNKLAGSNNRA